MILLIGNRIYDLTNWTHPGGYYIWAANKWREVSRYFYGAYSDEKLENTPNTHNHSQHASRVIEQYYIGKINPFKNEENWVLLDKTSGLGALSDFQSWKKTSQVKISNSTSVYLFKNDNFVINPTFSGVEFFGRHWLVYSEDMKKVRNYTNCTSFLTDYRIYREELIKLYSHYSLNDKSQQNNMELKNENNIKYLQTIFDKIKRSNNLPLVIKTYEQGIKLPSNIPCVTVESVPLSRDLNQSAIGTDVVIEGPIGRGLELTKHSKGDFVFISAGTGFLPFVD